MHFKSLLVVTLVINVWSLSALANQTIVKVGSELVNPNALKPFTAQWDQFSTVEGKKVRSATYQESLEFVEKEGDKLLKHIQVVKDQSGTQVTNTTLFDQATMKPLVIEQRIKGALDGSPDNRKFTFGDSQYVVAVTMPDGNVHSRTVHMPVDMFNVSNLGLVFATLPLKLGETYRMPSVFPQYQDGMYWMDAIVSGEKNFTNQQGKQVSAWQVDIRWINIKGGDEYPAGPKHSGGAYYIAKKGSRGIPPVPAYVNDSIAIEVSNAQFKK